MVDLDTRILKELVYQRVRACVNLCQLVLYEEELGKGIRRALASSPDDDDEAARAADSELARRLIAESWERLGREWDVLRGDMDALEES